MQQFDDGAIPHSLTSIEGQAAVWVAGANFDRCEVVGEAFNPVQMQRIVTSVQGRFDVVVPAWLIPEPDNQQDPTAVVVWVLGGKAGYLPRELATRWQPVLTRLGTMHGRAVACQAQLDPPSPANHGGYGIVVWLPPIAAPKAPAAEPPRALPAPPPFPAPRAAPAAPSVAGAGPALNVTPATVVSEDELARLRAAIEVAKQELESVEESLDIQSFGFYKPRYGFRSAAEYTARLAQIREEQKALIKDGQAAPCETSWTVGGSVAEGRRMTKQQAKLMLRAFNGECDAAIAKVRYDNITKLEDRIAKSFREINKLGEVQQVFVAERYYELKLAELRLVHEHREKLQAEKDEQRRIREQMRDEQRAEEEIARAQQEAEEQEAKSLTALERARADLAAAEATSKQHARLEGLVSRLESELKEALDRKAKAIARAQLTRSGHVYVLSNIGSFGEGIYKIGLTRRLDPQERVDELGTASVPFPFDVHAVIFAEDAPALEHKLHQAFAARRVNMVNRRKEYFRVTLDEIRTEVERLHGLVTFVIDHEAEQYRKTMSALTAGVHEVGEA